MCVVSESLFLSGEQKLALSSSSPTDSKLIMAVKCHDQSRKLLFSELFKDEDMLSEKPPNITQKLSRNESISSGFGSQLSSFTSDSSSPFGSELGSAETESEEDEEGDDFIAELTRQMADYMLNEDDEEDQMPPTESEIENSKESCGLLGSPPSLFCGSDFNDRHGKGTHSTVGGSTEFPAYIGFNNDQLKDQQFMKDRAFGNWENQGRQNSTESNRQPRTQSHKQRHGQSRQRYSASYGALGPFSPTSRVPQQLIPQQQKQRVNSGSAMRAVFLGGSGSVNGSCGTGVFLPRATSDPPETRKKRSGCSTFLIPARVMQVLQLHFADLNARSNGGIVLPQSIIKNLDEQRRPQTMETSASEQPQEIALPQEWTY